MASSRGLGGMKMGVSLCEHRLGDAYIVGEQPDPGWRAPVAPAAARMQHRLLIQGL